MSIVFLRLSDIADALPPYREEVEYCDLQPELAEAYQAFERTLKKAAQAALTKHDYRVLGQMLSSLLAWPDMPQRVVEVFDRDNCVVASAPALDIPLTAKDERLIECVRNAKAVGRKSLVFAEYTGKFGAGASDTLRRRVQFPAPQAVRAHGQTSGLDSRPYGFRRLRWPNLPTQTGGDWS